MAAELRIGAQLAGAMRTDAKELKAVRLYVERQPNYRLDRLPFLVAYCVPALIVARDVAGGHACAAALSMTLILPGASLCCRALCFSTSASSVLLLWCRSMLG
jgi:hypothetical protein